MNPDCELGLLLLLAVNLLNGNFFLLLGLNKSGGGLKPENHLTTLSPNVWGLAW